jgi:PHS family inorganic phosphate transporter-like MFS transporter
VGISLIPAFGTLYQRLTLPESTRYENTKSTQNPESGSITTATKRKQDPQSDQSDSSSRKGANESDSNLDKGDDDPEVPPKKKAHFKEVLAYFREYCRLRLIIGAASCWFLVDVSFYGINLNQNIVLQQIGFYGSSGTPWEQLFKIATGNIIITVLGFVPGYWVTVLTVEKLGRKYIQIQGFVMTSIFCECFSYHFVMHRHS